MIFTATDVAGAYIIDVEPHTDERGLFARTWSVKEIQERGLEEPIVQCSTSFNRYEGTLRGMHYQVAPHEEGKYVRCTRGRAYDVAVDLRPESPSYKQWVGTELSAENRRTLYVPPGCAHGFLTREDATEIYYQITAPYAPAHARGVRWDDPAFGITWPAPVLHLKERDRTYPDFID